MTDIALSLIYRVGILFLAMIPGFILRKCKLVPEAFGKGLSGFVLYAAQPSLVFLAYLRPYDAAVLRGAGWVLLFSIVAHAFFAVVALLLFRRATPDRQKILRMTTVFSNAAFMGIPLIDAIFGATATLYATVYNIPFNLVLWSLGTYICTHGNDLNEDGVNNHHDRRIALREGLRSIRVALLHPVTIAAALGLVFFFLPIEDKIPSLFTETLQMLADTVAPLSMVVIGLRLANTNFKGLLRDGQMYLFLALRHLLLPFGVLLLMKGAALLFPSVDTTVISVVLILAACPAASSATMFAERYDCDAAYAGKLVTVSTALSILTMPLLLLLV
ncbi:MAG: AEC family transporter [Clostridia bacterium]|nr:AEC family transporter [Clostridia bacterium]